MGALRWLLLAVGWLPFWVSAQTSAGVLEILTGDCRADSMAVWPGPETVQIFKLPQDSLVLQVVPRSSKELPVRITSLSPSGYRIFFENNFGQTLTKEVLVKAGDTARLALCPDRLYRYPQNTLAQLHPGDSILIKFFTQGCFHINSFKIIIRKKANQILAELLTDKMLLLPPEKLRNTGNTDTLLRTTVLNPQQLAAFVRFENELGFVNGSDCTTTDRYELHSHQLNLEVTDKSCKWNGFYFLRDSFFPED